MLKKVYKAALASTLAIVAMSCTSPVAEETSNTTEINSTESRANHLVAVAYNRHDYTGDSFNIYSNTEGKIINFPSEWNDKISSVKIIDNNFGVYFYQHWNGGGEVTDLNTSTISQRTADRNELPNDTFTGYKVYKDTKPTNGEHSDNCIIIKLYEHANFQGAYRDIRFKDINYNPDGAVGGFTRGYLDRRTVRILGFMKNRASSMLIFYPEPYAKFDFFDDNDVIMTDYCIEHAYSTEYKYLPSSANDKIVKIEAEYPLIDWRK